MIYKELKKFLETLSEKQLSQQVVVINEDEETPLMVNTFDISEEDIYWEHHGDCLGNLEEAKSFFTDGEIWEDEKEDLIIVPKGTVTLNT